MSDQAPIEDTPVTTTPDGAVNEPATQEVNWEERYKHLQADYTRATQEAAQLRSLAGLLADDEETRLQALSALGYEFAEPDASNTPDDDLDPVAAELAEMRQWREQVESREAQRQQEAEQAAREAQLDQIDKDCQRQLAELDGLDEDERDWIYSRALTTHHTPEGLPDIKAAHEEFVARRDGWLQNYAKSKQAPHVPGSGTSATQVPDLDDPAQRQAWMKERARAMAADQ